MPKYFQTGCICGCYSCRQQGFHQAGTKRSLAGAINGFSTKWLNETMRSRGLPLIPRTTLNPEIAAFIADRLRSPNLLPDCDRPVLSSYTLYE